MALSLPPADDAALVRDAMAAFAQEAMHATHEINKPSFAHAILTTDQLLAALQMT
jgi:hypothetical protein